MALKKMLLIIHLLDKEYLCIGFGYINRVLKSSYLSIHLFIKCMVVDVMDFSQGEIQVSRGYSKYIGGTLPGAHFKLVAVRTRGALAYLQQSLNTKRFNPKDGNSCIL